jgi:hypothetical protein
LIPAHIEVDAGKQLSSHLGTHAREPGRTATGDAPGSAGGDADPSYESVARHRDERGHTTQEGCGMAIAPIATRLN